jgi:hypothetical protein
LQFKASRYTRRVLVEPTLGRLKRVIGDALRSRTHQRRTTSDEMVATL